MNATFSNTATSSISARDLVQLRMRAQWLAKPTDASEPEAHEAGTPAKRVAATTRHMLALQGQDWRAVRWALGQRTANITVSDVHEAFNSGLIVRSWPMRGTVHVVAAEDIGWMQQITSHRVLAGAPKRREFLGISDAVLERLVEVSTEAMRGGASFDRDELSELWTAAGIEWKPNWRYHLIWWLCQNGLAVFGPTGKNGEPRLVSAKSWIAHPRSLTGDEALAELAARYAHARGAVTAKDFAWWTGLTAAEAKRGLTLAAEDDRLTRLRLDPGDLARTATAPSQELWADTEWLHAATRDNLGSAWRLLGAFDEHLLGYQDRSPQLAPEHLERVLPGRNGMFLATVVRDGRVVGTWKKGTRKSEGLVATPFPGETIDPELDELHNEARRWAQFHEVSELPLTVAARV